MRRYRCTWCGWIYDPERGDVKRGIPPGIPFEDLPEGWTCPACNFGKDAFVTLD
ncbi:MAG TPA: rubredoxin [Candidatus Sumerlaeota bacterium]|nr:rubredoxin [Candidatus Sumerlaeota bacterium]